MANGGPIDKEALNLMATARAARVRGEIARETGLLVRSLHDSSWVSVWRQRRKTKKKMEHFFGEHIPIDISIADIDRYGLEALVHSRVPLIYFVVSLLEQMAIENLLCFIEIDRFKKASFANGEARRDRALSIYANFINQDSDFEVNIDGKTQAALREALQVAHRDCFNAISQRLLALMAACYRAFRSSALYTEMKADIEDRSRPYESEVRRRAITKLVDFLDERMPMDAIIAITDGSIPEALRRLYVLRQMLHHLVKTRLNCDFYDTKELTFIKLPSKKVFTKRAQQELDLTRLLRIE